MPRKPRVAPEHCKFENCKEIPHWIETTDRYSKLKRIIHQDYCYEHWILVRNSRNKNTQSSKVRVCKVCGETDIDKMAKSNVGINYCMKCDTVRRQNFTKKFTQDPSYIEKQKLQWKLKMEKLSDEEKSVYFNIQSISAKNWHEKLKSENPDRHKKLFEKWNNIVRDMSPEARKAYYDKTVSRRRDRTEAEISEWKLKISSTLKNKTEEEKLRTLQRRKETISQMTEAELDDWYYNISKGVREHQISNPSHAEISGQRFRDYWTVGDVEGRKLRASLRQKSYWSNLSMEKKKQRILATMTATRFNSVSNAELECLEFLKIRYPDVEHQLIREGFNIDFYIPSLNLYVSYMGEYWHMLKVRNLQDYFHRRLSRRGRNTIKTAKRDRRQFRLFNNIVAIKDSQFRRDPVFAISIVDRYTQSNGNLHWKDRLQLKRKN